ncbi:type II secretion system protein [Clostridioides sp. GD02377]|uniref:type II secretion system protein n=1 Tax=unclassified Clostridioides TaxID=2635829 RepID=UPI0038B1288C
MKLRKNKKGFTLVELLVVIAIIGILAVVAVPALFSNINKAKVASVESDYSSVKSAALSYYSDKNKVPKDIKDDLAEYMETVPTKADIGGDYELFSTGTKLALKIGNSKGASDPEGTSDEKPTLTKAQLDKLKSDIGVNKIYTNSNLTEKLSENEIEDKIIYLVLIDNTNL